MSKIDELLAAAAGRDGWPMSDRFPAAWMHQAHESAVYTAAHEDGRYWSVHVSDLDGAESYYWADDQAEARIYDSPGALYEHALALGYSGPLTLQTRNFTVLREDEVLV